MDTKDLIKEYRKKRNLTQQQLADAVGVNRVTITKYENGSIAPPLKMLESIAKKLECNVFDLIDDKLFSKNVRDEQQRLSELAAFEAYMYSRKEHSIVKAAGYTWISPSIDDGLIHLIDDRTKTEYTIEEGPFFSAIKESMN